MIRVSNAAVTMEPGPGLTRSSHSRIPSPRDTRRSPARSAASVRVRGFVMPWAWVGPPTTSSATSSGIVTGASPTSTASTVMVAEIPSAIASATARVFPNIDS